MDVNQILYGDILIVKLKSLVSEEGKYASSNTGLEMIGRLIQCSHCYSKVILDFKLLEYIDSEKLTFIISFQKQLKVFKVHLILVNINHRLHRIFRITKLNKIFLFSDKSVEALLSDFEGELKKLRS